MSDRSDDMVESRPRDARGQKKGSRDWAAARKKVNVEGCRLSGHALHVCDGYPEAAHTIGRRYDTFDSIDQDDKPHAWVNPDSIVPLCANAHREYDAHRLDILPYLTLDEQADAVKRVGIVRAIARLTGARRPDWQSAGLVASQPKDQQVEEEQ